MLEFHIGWLAGFVISLIFFAGGFLVDKLVSLFHSRRFWIAVSGVVVLIVEPFGVEAATAQNIVLVLSAWVVGDSITKTE